MTIMDTRIRSEVASKSEKIRASLNHPVIDSDGHMVEFQPGYFDVLNEIAGSRISDQFLHMTQAIDGDYNRWYAQTPEERRNSRIARPAWWSFHAQNTLDRATASLPQLLHNRMDEIGLDFAVVYPSIQISTIHLPDEEMRRATSRAYNTFVSRIFREYSDRLTPVAVIPMHTPSEAIEELEYAVHNLGLKSILMPSHVARPRTDGQGVWYDVLALDSAHDYDPVWAKCIELKLAPTFHSGSMGIGTRNSISSYMYNHIGHFAAGGEALCKAVFLGGVAKRFPNLRFGFLEGGVGWACSLYSDLIGHWKKRNGARIEYFDPANLDREYFLDLHRKYGGEMVKGKLDDDQNQALTFYNLMSAAGGMKENPELLDEFSQCGVSKPEDIRDQFANNFFFGCEADDPINSWAFDDKRNPYGARLNAIFSSDIGHWDVDDMREVLEEAYELVEHELITEGDFRDFVFGNPVKLYTGMNPDFFKGTVVEQYL